MKELLHLQNISDLHKLFKLVKSTHPLVTVLDFSKVNDSVEEKIRITTDFYSIMFKNYCKNTLKYGRKEIDFQDGSLVCIAPNQSIETDTMGWGLFFHPDLIRSTSLNEKMSTYTFFSYEVTEALHLSEKEKMILFEYIQKINTELQENIDEHSQYIIVSTIELLLNYCLRFYGRQMITRNQTHKLILSQIEKILTNYFTNNETNSYLSDLLKKETGKNAKEHIHFYIIESAKSYLKNTEKNINEIAYNLGFDYPQYFNKLFKQKTGKTPVEYRNLI